MCIREWGPMGGGGGVAAGGGDGDDDVIPPFPRSVLCLHICLHAFLCLCVCVCMYITFFWIFIILLYSWSFCISLFPLLHPSRPSPSRHLPPPSLHCSLLTLRPSVWSDSNFGLPYISVFSRWVKILALKSRTRTVCLLLILLLKFSS